MNSWADQMEALADSMKVYTPKSKKAVAAFASMTIAINQLRDHKSTVFPVSGVNS